MTLSNNGPVSADIILDSLNTKYAEQLKRFAELKEAFERFPNTVDTAEVAANATVYEKMLGSFITQIEAIHKEEKAPWLEGGRTIDNYFLAGMSKVIEPLKKKVNERRTAWQVKIAEEERQARIKLAAEQKAEADKLAASMQTESDLDKAIEVTEQASQAQITVETFKASDVGRIKTDFGVTSSLQYEWVGEITNQSELDLAKLRPFLSADVLQKALSAYVKISKFQWAEDASPEFKGARIFRKAKSVTR